MGSDAIPTRRAPAAARGLSLLLGPLALLANCAHAGESAEGAHDRYYYCHAERYENDGFIYNSERSLFTSVEVVSVGGVKDHTTYRLMGHLPSSSEVRATPAPPALRWPCPRDLTSGRWCPQSVYSIFGSPTTSGLLFPPAHQEPKPFGVDLGGVDPAFVAIKPGCAYDSWISLGITEGDSRGRLSTVGIDFESWDSSTALRTDTTLGGSVFFMDPDDSELLTPSGGDGDLRSVVLAQLTLPTALSSQPIHLNAQGRSVGHSRLVPAGDTPLMVAGQSIDWQETCVTVHIGGDLNGRGTHALPAPKPAVHTQGKAAVDAPAGGAEDHGETTCERMPDPAGGHWHYELMMLQGDGEWHYENHRDRRWHPQDATEEVLVGAELHCYPGFRAVHTRPPADCEYEDQGLSLSCGASGEWEDSLCGAEDSMPKCVRAPEQECRYVAEFGARADAVTTECCDGDCNGLPSNCSRNCKVLLAELSSSCTPFLMENADEGHQLLGTINTAVKACFRERHFPRTPATLACADNALLVQPTVPHHRWTLCSQARTRCTGNRTCGRRREGRRRWTTCSPSSQERRLMRTEG
eukprot:COSAG04_NODE_3164_length_3099_cov_3.504000_1_plen_579_part_10